MAISAEWISAAANCVVGISAAAAAWQGIKGLKNWRSETVGKRHIELAEDGLAGFYEIEGLIKAIRSPLSSEAESADRHKDEYESNAEQNGRDKGYVTLKRYERHSEAIAKFRAQGLRVKAVFGPAAYEPYEAMWDAIKDVIVSARMFSMTPHEGYQDHDMTRQWDRHIWDHDSKDPESVEQRVGRAVQSAEALLGKYLR